MVLGDVARDLGHTADARDRCEESLAIFRELGEPLGEGFCLNNLALAAYGEGDLDLARTLSEESWPSFVAWMSGRDGGGAGSLGPILDTAGDPASALAALTEALRLALRVGPRWVVAATLEGIAKVAAGQRQDLVAVELASGAAALRMEIGVPVRPDRRADLDRRWQRRVPRSATRPCRWLDPRPGVAPSRRDCCRGGGEDRLSAPVSRPRTTRRPTAHMVCQRVNSTCCGCWWTASSSSRSPRCLFISPRTASKHVGAILLKLDVMSRGEAAVHAVRHALI